jgi:hypothetical protein
MKCTSVRFLKLPRINLKELVVETYKVKLMFVPLPTVKISRQCTRPQQYGKWTLTESKFLRLPILIHISKNEIVWNYPISCLFSRFPISQSHIYMHTYTYIHYVDPSVCHMAFGHEINHSAKKTWLYKTVTSTKSQKVDHIN